MGIRELAMSILLVFGVMLAGNSAHAQRSNYQFETGNTLLEKCESRQGTTGYYICLGYLVGVADTFDALRPTTRFDYCLREGATNAQLQRVVVKYLKEHPEELDLSAGWLVVLALTDAFHCSPE